MPIKVRAVPEGWTLLFEMIVPPDGFTYEWAPFAPIHFTNGEQLIGINVTKPVGNRARKPGLFRLYRNKRGHPAYRASRYVQFKPYWSPRPYAYNQPEKRGRHV